MESKELLQWVAERKGLRDGMERNLSSLKERMDSIDSNLKELRSVRDLLNSFIQTKQKAIVDACCGLGTLMLQNIYGEEYKLDLRFESKRNKSEANLVVSKGDLELSLDDETGGGIVDIVALAMRLALWSLMEPRTDPVFIMDEPAKFVSKDKLPLLGEMLRELCSKLGIQIIMVSHEDQLVEVADKSYRVSMLNGVSEVM